MTESLTPSITVGMMRQMAGLDPDDTTVDLSEEIVCNVPFYDGDGQCCAIRVRIPRYAAMLLGINYK